VNPGIPIPEAVTELTGIRDADVAGYHGAAAAPRRRAGVRRRWDRRARAAQASWVSILDFHLQGRS
jgi:hypothetical protein